MNVKTILDTVLINETHILSYDEKIEIIKVILNMQEEFSEIENDWEMTALGLQTLSDKSLVIILNDVYTLNAIKFFIDLDENI